ncbi:fumarylacetoacetate hydrolase family protein [Chthonobacter albigriseus]|uniref:fumarylacetoacetate hydrolase family protein n=1 Tax=Chthonobacter albigriseus TaxID=1683161 RepID=UPI0015EFAFA7|nr:fumarylacetoacetate hydrolase family protein [Chthonobacter albigriseus]
MLDLDTSPASALPSDADAALVGRLFRPEVNGPSVVKIAGDRLIDVSATFPTVRDLCETPDPAAALKAAPGEDVGSLAEVLAATPARPRDAGKPYLLSPVDLQAIKAAGVTFAASMLERVIEERARGNADAAAAIRTHIRELVGEDLRRLRPGSPEAMALKDTLVREGAWSQYLEVGIGPDAEIFTKAQPMSSVGTLADIGVHPKSTWNNPEPEVVLVVSSTGSIVGATLGNDVNLRDVEGRSALLLGKAKDNNASAAIGPFLRLFDGAFTLDTVRRMDLTLDVLGEDGFHLQGRSSLSEISRDPADLVAQTLNAHHRYPDGFVLYLGTMFAPVDDRDAPGRGFTHKHGDIVRIAAPALGTLVNRVVATDEAEPWTFGVAALMRNLADRRLLGT